MTFTWDNNKELYIDYLNLFKKLNIHNFDIETLNRFDQIHAGGISITKKIANLTDLKKGETILELGGGIGGVARFLAKNYDQYVYNLDLSFSYSLTGLKLSSLIKEDLKIFFINGDANHIPFKENTFDVVWLQHINMNIFDKKNLFKEIKRVIKNNGIIVFHEWFINNKNDNNLLYPLPWSDTPDYNFLICYDDFINLAKSSDLNYPFLRKILIMLYLFIKNYMKQNPFQTQFLNIEMENIFSKI